MPSTDDSPFSLPSSCKRDVEHFGDASFCHWAVPRTGRRVVFQER